MEALSEISEMVISCLKFGPGIQTWLMKLDKNAMTPADLRSPITIILGTTDSKVHKFRLPFHHHVPGYEGLAARIAYNKTVLEAISFLVSMCEPDQFPVYVAAHVNASDNTYELCRVNTVREGWPSHEEMMDAAIKQSGTIGMRSFVG